LTRPAPPQIIEFEARLTGLVGFLQYVFLRVRLHGCTRLGGLFAQFLQQRVQDGSALAQSLRSLGTLRNLGTLRITDLLFGPPAFPRDLQVFVEQPGVLDCLAGMARFPVEHAIQEIEPPPK
jgi:hypothetical protein